MLTFLQTMIDLAVEYDKVMEQVSNHSKSRQTDSALKALAAQIKEREKCQKALLDLYPDWKADLITKEEYLMLKANLTEKIAGLEERIATLEASQNTAAVQPNEFAEHFRQYKNIDRLTRPLLVELIESIYVHEGNRITIKVKFFDELEKILTLQNDKRSA